MIKPLNLMTNTMMSNPIRANQANMVFKSALNNNKLGEKLNINYNDSRFVTRNGQKLDIIA